MEKQGISEVKVYFSPKMFGGYRNNSYLCSVKWKFDYPGKFPAGEQDFIDTTPFKRATRKVALYFVSIRNSALYYVPTNLDCNKLLDEEVHD